MPCLRYIIVIFTLLSFSFQSSAQHKPLSEMDITGLWRGFMYNDTTQLNYRYEIAITEEKGKLYGYSHTYFIINDKQYHGVKKIKIKREGNLVITTDVDLIVNNYPVNPPKGVHMTNILKFEMKDTVMILSGLFSTNRTREFAPATGYVHVERKKDYSQSALVPHLQELGLAKNLTFLSEETTKPSEEILAVLKPLQSDEEERLIIATAKKQQPDNTIKPANTVVVKTEPLKTVETVAAKPATQKPAEPVIAKVTPPVVNKVPEKIVTAPVKTETAAAKPVIQKPAEPVVAKVTPPVVTKTPEKVTEAVVTKPAVVKKPDVIDPLAATDAGKRKVENIQAIYFKSDSLQLILYDNGEVDGDTVSVIMNGTVIMPRVGLSTNAVKKTIDTRDAGDSIQLVMYAESLGSLPPNTGLLIVYDGKDRYEIRFSGDMQKSSGIVFRRRKE
jgi:hypothetical protein